VGLANQKETKKKRGKKMITFREIQKRYPRGVSFRYSAGRGRVLEAYCFMGDSDYIDSPALFFLTALGENNGIPNYNRDQIAISRLINAIAKRFGGNWVYITCDCIIVQKGER
jgi:hypothetical protein